jgi:methionyl-tRNA formyltransferase
MRIVFMGTPVFAQRPLELLYREGHDIAGVFTQPDKPQKRGMKVIISPVKELALRHGTPVYQPTSLKGGEAAEMLRKLKCELIAVVAYGRILTRDMLEVPYLGSINIHGSLLPKYRGAAPIQWAVINGEKETGLTSMYISDELDSGDTIYKRRTTIGEDETAGELYERLSLLAAELLKETIDAISRGEAPRVPQDHAEATFAPPLKKEMSPIDWTESASSIKNKVRGLNPWPVATTELGGTPFKVFRVETGGGTALSAPGSIVSAGRHGIEVACADGTVTIKELQTPGGKRMAADEYLRGNNIMHNS